MPKRNSMPVTRCCGIHSAPELIHGGAYLIISSSLGKLILALAGRLCRHLSKCRHGVASKRPSTGEAELRADAWRNRRSLAIFSVRRPSATINGLSLSRRRTIS